MSGPDPSPATEEIFDLVDETGRVVGQAPRRACHGNPALLHCSVHVLVWNRDGDLLLQKRAQHKDTQPGRWDTSVGGHFLPGECPEAAARREMREELGIDAPVLRFEYRYLWRTAFESELVHTFSTVHDGPFRLDPAEIDEARFWSEREIRSHWDSGTLTPNFLHEYETFRAHRGT